MTNKHLEQILAEFDKEFSFSSVHWKDAVHCSCFNEEDVTGIKQFISQSFLKYSQAYLEDILPKEKEPLEGLPRTDELVNYGYNQALADIKSNLNKNIC